MTYTEFGGAERPKDLGIVQDEVDRAFPESEETESLFGSAADEEPENVSAEPGGLIDLEKLDEE